MTTKANFKYYGFVYMLFNRYISSLFFYLLSATACLWAIIKGTASLTRSFNLFVLSIFYPEGHQEPCSEVGSLSPAKHFVKFKSGTLRFVHKATHQATIYSFGWSKAKLWQLTRIIIQMPKLHANTIHQYLKELPFLPKMFQTTSFPHLKVPSLILPAPVVSHSLCLRRGSQFHVQLLEVHLLPLLFLPWSSHNNFSVLCKCA